MKASSIIENVINIKSNISKVNKNSDNNFESYINSGPNNQNRVNDKVDSEVKTENLSENKTLFKKIENIKPNKAEEKKGEEILSEKLPKKIEQIINFIGSHKVKDVSPEKVVELKELLQSLLSKIKELKSENKTDTKEEVINILKEINSKLRELFPEKDIKINLVNFKDNFVIDIDSKDKSILIQVDDEKLKVFKYKNIEKPENKNQLYKDKIPEILNINEEKTKDSKENIIETGNNSKEKQILLSLIHEEKIKSNNSSDKTLTTNDETKVSKETINNKTLLSIKDLIDRFLKQQHTAKTNKKNNDSKIKLSQMLINKNNFLKISKNISYFDLTSRLKTNTKNKIEKNVTKDGMEKATNKNTILSNDLNYNPIEKVENKEARKDYAKKKGNEKIEKTNSIENPNKNVKNNTTQENRTSKKQNIEISTVSNNKTNNPNSSLTINKTTFNQPINLREFNAQITDIINQKSTENTFREIVTIKINPPNLGNVDVEIMKNGKAISISVITENESAKNFISRTIQSLIGSLRDQGFNPVNVKVETPPEPDLMDTEKQDDQKNKQEQQKEEKDEDKEFENILRGEENV
ncbi:flagellar hook-length control protein FliK [Geotoga petraea]|uniref:Flagellar hook-length control protein-like C-terminal domain-containing protein n=1 Tax=Geotoga petraea TaxID=28234 RepID=A0A4Z0W5X5_9BACT|nr:flagellar hook-length control protein FliK [Geotoga petraea]TGG89250.1 hypothetical protein E4650_03420 [Geotoga petraea]